MRSHVPAHPSTGLLVAGGVLLIDQVTKAAAAHGRSGIVFPARNPSYAFGVIGGPAPMLILGALVVLGLFLVVAGELVIRLGVSIYLPALIAGGMAGNVLDRIRFGATRDFLVVPWAIVNVADFAIAIGVIGILIAFAVRVPRLREELAPASR